MRYRVSIKGIRPLIMHNGAAGLDTRSPQNVEKLEISRKKGSNRTIEDDERLAVLECMTSLWLDENGRPTVPARAIRSTIETGARKIKQGPQVREGLIVEDITKFYYDESLGTTAEELGETVQFTVPVVVQRNRILRTRARFDEWALDFSVEGEDDLVDADHLTHWLTIAGRRIGLGDWRPEKSGNYGRFALLAVEAVGA